MNQETALPKRENDTRNAADILRGYAAKGFLFHASATGDLKRLEPRPGRDANEKDVFSNDTAVFASPDLLFCMPFAFVDWKEAVFAGGMWEAASQGCKMPVSWRLHIENAATGYVYVLPPDSFTLEEGPQRKSRDAVVPVDCVPVKFYDYQSLGGEVEWLPDNPP